MLNKKGSSLLELIISIALISVVMGFLVKLLVDLNNKDTNSDFAINNQVNRAEIIRAIENDLLYNKIVDITDTSSTEDNLKVDITYHNNKTSSINVTKNKFTYENINGDSRVWTMKNATLSNNAYIYYDKDNKTDGSDNIYSLILNIEVYTLNDNNKKGNNNSLDDITISYIGKVNDYNNIQNCLGYNCKH